MSNVHDARSTAEKSDFAAMTCNQAYVRPLDDDGEIYYGIYDAEGRMLAIAPTRAMARASIRQHDLVPVDAH